jgi:hypothetical protein
MGVVGPSHTGAAVVATPALWCLIFDQTSERQFDHCQQQLQVLYLPAYRVVSSEHTC